MALKWNHKFWYPVVAIGVPLLVLAGTYAVDFSVRRSTKVADVGELAQLDREAPRLREGLEENRYQEAERKVLGTFWKADQYATVLDVEGNYTLADAAAQVFKPQPPATALKRASKKWYFLELVNPGKSGSLCLFGRGSDRAETAWMSVNEYFVMEDVAAGGKVTKLEGRPTPSLFGLGFFPSNCVRVNLQANATYLVAVRSSHQVRLAMSVTTPERWQSWYFASSVFAAFYYGAILCLVLYNMFVFAATRAVAYFYYLVTLLGVHIAYGPIHFVPNFFVTNLAAFDPGTADTRSLIGLCIGWSATSLFFRDILSGYRGSKWLYRAIFTLGLAAPAVIVTITVALYFERDAYSLTDSLLAPTLGLLQSALIVSALIAAVRGNRTAKYLTAAWLAPVFMAVYNVAIVNHIDLGLNLYFEHVAGICLLIEGVVFSLALADRINTLRRERDDTRATSIIIKGLLNLLASTKDITELELLFDIFRAYVEKNLPGRAIVISCTYSPLGKSRTGLTLVSSPPAASDDDIVQITAEAINAKLLPSDDKADRYVYVNQLDIANHQESRIHIAVQGTLNPNEMVLVELVIQQLVALTSKLISALDLAIAKAQADHLLECVPEAIFTISTPEAEIDSSYSVFTNQLFGKGNIAALNLIDIMKKLFEIDGDSLEMIRSVVGFSINNSMLSFDMNGHALARELRTKDGRWIEFSWNPIADGFTCQEIMVVARDITTLKELNEKSTTNQQKVVRNREVLGAGIQNFSQFMNEAKDMLADVDRMIGLNAWDADNQKIVLRRFHTLKGNSRILNLSLAVGDIHEAETIVTSALANGTQDLNSEISRANDMIKSALNAYFDAFDVLLSKINRDIQINLWTFEFIKASCASGVDFATIGQKIVEKWAYFSMRDAVDALETEISHIAGLEGAEVPKVVVAGESLRIPMEHKPLMNAILVHCISNSLKHGLESGKERLGEGKTAQGTISIEVSIVSGELVMLYRDDGRGLNLKKIREMGVNKGLIAANADDLTAADCIFADNLSTAAQVDVYAGRGVGMSAVRSDVVQLGGAVDLVLGEGTTGQDFRPFAIRIRVPQARLPFLAA